MLSALAGGQLGMLAEGRGASVQALVWSTLTGWTQTGQVITKTAAHDWNNNLAISALRAASGDCSVAWKANSTVNTTIIIGITNNDDAGYPSVLHGLYASDGSLYTMEGGSFVLRSTYTSSDELEIRYEGGVAKYFKNAGLIYTSLVSPAYPARIKAVAYYQGSSGTVVGIGGNWA